MTLSTRFEEALLFATHIHAGQVRKGTNTPYIAHLMAVAAIVLEQGATEDETIAALLHDAAEDQGGRATLEEIRNRFGEVVADIVEDCTDSWTTPRPPWRARKEAFLARLRDASASVCLVSAADKLHNARTILTDYRTLGESLWSRFNGGKEGTLWYYRAVVAVLRDSGPVPLVDELERVVSKIELLAS
jgi:GTP pyrophosphokinase